MENETEYDLAMHADEDELPPLYSTNASGK